MTCEYVEKSTSMCEKNFLSDYSEGEEEMTRTSFAYVLYFPSKKGG